MTFYLKNNAYHVLGLDTTSSPRECLKRSKEIIARLSIGDAPAYDGDLHFFDHYRTIETVKLAMQRLQTPRKHIAEFFFWFHCLYADDKAAYQCIRERNYDGAAAAWSTPHGNNAGGTAFAKKNLALLYTLLLTTQDNKDLLTKSLRAWKDVVGSDALWSEFEKGYAMHNSHVASHENVSEFRKQVVTILSDMYAQLHQIHNGSAYVAEFQSVFLTKGAIVETAVLNPAYQAINDAVEDLEAMAVSEDGVLDLEERQQIKEHIGTIQGALNRLIDYGLYDDSQTKAMRDRAAKAIRTIVLDLHNNLNETEMGLGLIGVAISIVGTASLRADLEQDIVSLTEIQKRADIVKPISDLIADQQYARALQLIPSERSAHPNDSDLNEYYDGQTKLCVTMVALEKYKRARELFNNNQFAQAAVLYREAGSLIYNNIALYNYNKETLDGVLKEVSQNAMRINANNLDQFDEYRNSYLKLATDTFEGKMEEPVFIALIDSYLFGHLCEFIGRKRQNTRIAGALNVIGWFTIPVYGIGLLFWAASAYFKNKN